MNVGMCRIVLHLPGNTSLKGKRQVLRSIIDRVKHRYNVSIAEVDNQDKWQLATIGISYVNGHHSQVQELLTKIVDYIESEAKGSAELIDCQIEVIQGF